METDLQRLYSEQLQGFQRDLNGLARQSREYETQLKKLLETNEVLHGENQILSEENRQLVSQNTQLTELNKDLREQIEPLLIINEKLTKALASQIGIKS